MYDVEQNAQHRLGCQALCATLGKMIITPAQCRAARGLVELDQAELAARASISRNTIVDFEKGRRTPNPNNLGAVRAALEAAGVEFIPENGGGAGVRLRKTSKVADHPASAGPAMDAIEVMDEAIKENRRKRKK